LSSHVRTSLYGLDKARMPAFQTLPSAALSKKSVGERRDQRAHNIAKPSGTQSHFKNERKSLLSNGAKPFSGTYPSGFGWYSPVRLLTHALESYVREATG